MKLCRESIDQYNLSLNDASRLMETTIDSARSVAFSPRLYERNGLPNMNPRHEIGLAPSWLFAAADTWMIATETFVGTVDLLLGSLTYAASILDLEGDQNILSDTV